MILSLLLLIQMLLNGLVLALNVGSYEVDILTLSRRYFETLLLFFPEKKVLTFHANCLLRRQFA